MSELLSTIKEVDYLGKNLSTFEISSQDSPYWFAHTLKREHAEEIVRARNSHAALVEALKWVVNHPGECLEDYPTVLCRCKDALKLAEGEPA